MQHRPPPPPPPARPPTSHGRSESASSTSSTGSSVSRLAHNFPANFSNSSSSTIKLVPPSSPNRTPRATPRDSPSSSSAMRPGYFEPSLSHNSPQTPQAPPSQMAAEFAMQAQRKRSATDPSENTSSPPTTVAGAAANAVFSRYNDHLPPPPHTSPSPGLSIPQPPSLHQSSRIGEPLMPPGKKESSGKKKLFGMPGRSGTPVFDKPTRPPASPNKHAVISGPIPRLAAGRGASEEGRRPSFGSLHSSASSIMNLSTATLVGSGMPSAAGSFSNSSQEPLAPAVEVSPPQKEKEHHTHKPHFLRARKDHSGTMFSSSASNSKAVSADGSSLYSFGPASPVSTIFGSSSKDLQKTISSLDISSSHHKPSKSSKASLGSYEDSLLTESGIGFGAEHTWHMVRVHSLSLFEGDPPKETVEYINKLVAIHIRKAVDRRNAQQLLQDVTDLFDAGMSALLPAFPDLPDERLILRLVDVWTLVFTHICPYLEGIFLPLQQEFKGGGIIMSSRESRDFFGITSPDQKHLLDTRRLIMISFRDSVVLPMYDRLRVVFSKLQVELFARSQDQATETVSRMLQCVSILSGVLTMDEKQGRLDELAKTLKHNWLSRGGRTGRNRMGFVGTKMRAGAV